MSLDNYKLIKMKNYLDLLSIAIVSLTNLESKTLEQAAKACQVALNEENLRIFAEIITNIAQQHPELIRHAVTLWENLPSQQQLPSQIILLADYLDRFSRKCPSANNQQLEQLGLKLLIDLLFYSTDHGSDRLWSVIES